MNRIELGFQCCELIFLRLFRSCLFFESYLFIRSAGKLKKLLHARLIKEFLLGWILQNFVCHEFLENLSMVNFLLDRVINDEAIDLYVSFLTDTEGTISGLKINHGVPIWVKYDYFICCCQIDA